MKEKTINKTREKILNSPIFKVIKFFFDNPYEEIHLRGLSKKLEISTYSTKEFLDFFVSIGFLTEEKKANLRYFKANLSNIVFRQLKIASNLKKIIDLGLIEYIQKNVSVLSSIVLFGSFAIGNDSKESDIDLVVIGKKRNELDLSKFEEKINKEITCFVFNLAEWKRKSKESKAFYQDVIINGIPLYGSLPMLE